MNSLNDTVIVASYMYIPVSDVNRSGEWYANHLGFRWNPDPKHIRPGTNKWNWKRILFHGSKWQQVDGNSTNVKPIHRLFLLE